LHWSAEFRWHLNKQVNPRAESDRRVGSKEHTPIGDIARFAQVQRARSSFVKVKPDARVSNVPRYGAAFDGQFMKSGMQEFVPLKPAEAEIR
jgi:hypothetical protein